MRQTHYTSITHAQEQIRGSVKTRGTVTARQYELNTARHMARNIIEQIRILIRVVTYLGQNSQILRKGYLECMVSK